MVCKSAGQPAGMTLIKFQLCKEKSLEAFVLVIPKKVAYNFNIYLLHKQNEKVYFLIKIFFENVKSFFPTFR